jgi:hypothetical protein
MNYPKTKKAQSSLEFLTTYGWVIIVAAVAIVALWQAGTFHPVPCTKNKFGFGQAMPVDWAAYRNSDTFVIEIENWAGATITVTKADAVMDEVICSSTPGVEIAPGDTAPVILDCSGDPSLSKRYRTGECYRAEVEMEYVNQKSKNTQGSMGKLRGAVEEGVVTTTTSTSTTTTTTSTIDGTPPLITIVSPPPGAVIVVQI